ncbi:hypothetical protein OG275_38145 (plasmid) [Streptomyces niveus]|uniref:hypothetical protein n=1 Tax=Streptomyces niveus TaxID=193462 RepID=UPI002E30CB74|nr:hypothetical protein [Streptomyces niveus]
MSDTNPMEQGARQTAQTAAIALQVLVIAAQALYEHNKREVTAPTPSRPREWWQYPPREIPVAERRSSHDPAHDRYAHMVRGTVQPAPVAEAMIKSAQWPQLADELKKLERAGVNVGTFLADAGPVISRMDADLRAGSPTPGVAVPSAATTPRDPWAGQKQDDPGLIKRFVEQVKKFVGWVTETASKLWGKVTRKDSTTALGDRSRELARLGISAQENARLVVVARESLADEGTLKQLVLSREWPGIAAQIKQLQESGRDPRPALAGVPTRIRQAAAAGIKLTPSEAAHGLLNEAKAATSAPATATPTAVLTSTETTPRRPTSAAAAPLTQSRAAAAAAQSTTATRGATPSPGPQASPTTPTAPATPTRTQGR